MVVLKYIICIESSIRPTGIAARWDLMCGEKSIGKSCRGRICIFVDRQIMCALFTAARTEYERYDRNKMLRDIKFRTFLWLAGQYIRESSPIITDCYTIYSGVVPKKIPHCGIFFRCVDKRAPCDNVQCCYQPSES